MSGNKNRAAGYAGYILIAVFLAVSFSGCGSAAAKVMASMPRKSFSEVDQYKVAIAEKATIDKILQLTGTTVPSNNRQLEFKNGGGFLKAVHVKLSDRVKKGDLLAELDTANLEYELGRKRLDLERAVLQYDKLTADAETGGGGNATELQSVKYDMESINLDITRISREISEARLTAPFAGTISEIATYNLGSPVETYTPFITISKLNEFEIVSSELNPPPGDFAVSNTDPSGVAAGMKAAMQYYYQNKKFEVPLTVIQVINSEPGLKTNDMSPVLSNEAPPLQLRLKVVDPSSANLSPNQVSTIKINAGKLENVIVVPRDAVSGFGEDTIVKVIKNGKVTKRLVTTGYEDKDSKIIVITSGLREGESVIVD